MTTSRLVFTCLFTTLLGLAACRNSRVEPTRTPRAERAPVKRLDLSALNDVVRAGDAAGLVVGVSRKGAVELVAFGWSDVNANRSIATEDVFRFASMTKTFTAVAVLQLVERGALTLDAPLSKVLPNYRSAHTDITVRQLLEHTSGIPNFTEFAAFAGLESKDVEPETLTALFKDEPLDFGPGSRFAYSNSGYVLLGMIVEQLSGERFGDYLAVHVLEPAGMKRTAMCGDVPASWSVVRGYARDPASGLKLATPISVRTPFAAGGLCGTASDVLRFWDALAHGKLVSPDSYRAMKEPGTLKEGIPRGYGLGVGFSSVSARQVVGHDGGIAGFSTAMLRDDDEDVTAVVLCNYGERRRFSHRETRPASCAGSTRPSPVVTTHRFDRERRRRIRHRWEHSARRRSGADACAPYRHGQAQGAAVGSRAGPLLGESMRRREADGRHHERRRHCAPRRKGRREHRRNTSPTNSMTAPSRRPEEHEPIPRA